MKKNSFNDHEFVDLGLPSGLLWATCNIGANSPEEYGDYFAWGETEPKDNYSWLSYKHAELRLYHSYDKAIEAMKEIDQEWFEDDPYGDWEMYKQSNDSKYYITKYCNEHRYGLVDNFITLKLEDDAAHKNWGDSWRMPNLEEYEELLEYCKWEWSKQNNINGFRVIGPTGNSIFLPAAGAKQENAVICDGTNGLYWSSSLYRRGPNGALVLRFSFGYLLNYPNPIYKIDLYSREMGRSIRPVCSPK